MSKIIIKKSDGHNEEYLRDKLIKSLRYSGASDSLIKKVVIDIEKSLYDGIRTSELYKNAFNKLKQHSRSLASRYKLKKSIMELGPTGYPFEKFIGELLKHQGFSVEIGVFVQGLCVLHEVDVVAEKENKHFMIECKFHSSFNIKCGVKTPLYINSRFIDIEKQWNKENADQPIFHQGWLVNNTRFSEDAIQYGNCVGLKLLSWDYPKTGNLKEQISISGLYPITCLSSLNKSEKQQLLNMDFVLCRQLSEKPEVLNELRIKNNRKKMILDDAFELCNS